MHEETRRDILLAEDEPAVREGLVLLLESEGYAVRAAADGEAALAFFRARRPDLVLLDVMMPKRNGFAVCREIRALDPDVPVLFLTALDSDADQLRGLGLGADDYLPKTVSEPVKLARIAAALRRGTRHAAASPEDGFAFGSARIDTRAFRIVRNGRAGEDLTLREIEILRCLRAHPHEALSRDFLLTRFWGNAFAGGDAALTMAFQRLRAKLGDDAACIETVRNVGYIYTGA